MHSSCGHDGSVELTLSALAKRHLAAKSRTSFVYIYLSDMESFSLRYDTPIQLTYAKWTPPSGKIKYFFHVFDIRFFTLIFLH